MTNLTGITLSLAPRFNAGIPECKSNPQNRFNGFSLKNLKPFCIFLILVSLTLTAIRPASAQPARKSAPQTDPQFAAELTTAAINQRIQRYRTAQAALTLTGADGQPLSGVPVTLRQTRHQFLFGCNAFGLRPGETSRLQLDYQKRLADLMNFATLGFYWGSFEPVEGQPQTERLRAMAEWCRQHNIATKGHPLCWTNVAPNWLNGRPVEQMETIQLARIRRDVTAFEGLVGIWDVVNEATWLGGDRPGQDNPIKRLFQGVGTVELVKRAFAEARRSNPAARLVLNDYKVGEDYRKLITDCIAAGIPIDVIGIQSHMHGNPWPATQTWAVCERFKGFGLPLHFTETTLLSGPFKEPRGGEFARGPRPNWPTTPEGERQQAERVAQFYTLLFSHPAVQAITWWDLSDFRAWKNAPAGLVRADMSPKPAYEALLKLVKGKWWTREVKATTDANGKVTFRGFLGDYALETPRGKATFKLEKAGSVELSIPIKMDQSS